MRLPWIPLCLLIVACRFDTGGVASDSGGPAPDGPQTPDASIDAPGPDAGLCGLDAGICCGEPDGRRVCAPSGSSSAACLSGEPVVDRDCPPGSACEGFVCTLQSACQACGGASCGVGQMCSVFAVTGSVNTCCTPCFGDIRGCGGPGIRCADNAQCASGICLVDDGGTGDGGPPDGGAGQCYYHCQFASECGDGGVCLDRLVAVDGLNRVLPTCRVP